MALEYFDNSKREMGDGKASLVLELLSTPVLTSPVQIFIYIQWSEYIIITKIWNLFIFINIFISESFSYSWFP